jgi:quercetin dioxygenase-like cupin family protein
MLTSNDFGQAQAVSSRLWTATKRAHGPVPPTLEWTHLPGAFTLEEVMVLMQGLPLGENRPPGQTVALVDGDEFKRESSTQRIEVAYQSKPRTQLFESIGVQSGGWAGQAEILLARLARCTVVCDMYVSYAGDASMDPHIDAWYGVILQVFGAKTWTLWDEEGNPQEVTTNAGDVLLLPRGVTHAIRTPHYSVHVVFGLMTHEPIDTTDS